MRVLQLTSQTDKDGALRLDIGVPNAKVRATVVVESAPSEMTDEERRLDWEKFVRQTAGSIPDPKFRRYAQGKFPTRERL